jgi:hypothetical protein
MMHVLQSGDLVRGLTVTRTDGSRWEYDSISQRRNLLLVVLPREPEPAGDRFAAEVLENRAEWDAMDTACVITRDAVAGVPAPGVLIADRWGEVFLVAPAADVSELPPIADLVAWVRSMEQKCPECEGEAR